MATTYTHIAANKRKSVFLLTFFVLIVIALGWAIDQWSESGGSLTIVALVVAILMSLVGYFQGDRIALLTAGARRIHKEKNPYLYRIVENLAITAGLPMPRVYIIDDAALNAFATGRDPSRASIAVTTGLLESLENEELEGVLAHELSHIGNYDIRFMMLVAILVGVVVLLSDLFFRATLWGGGGNNRRSGGGGVLAILGLVLIILSPVIAQIVRLALSRKREFLADASSALLTRYPDGLASALEKIGRSRPLQRASNATAHLYISNPFRNAHSALAKLFSTHPPIEERIAALRTMGGTHT